MSPKRGKNEIGLSGEGQTVVDASHRQNTHGASGSVDQFNVFRKQILQAEPIDGVRVAAADLHDAVMPVRISKPADLLARLADEFGCAEFVYEFHWSRPGPAAEDVFVVPQAVTADFVHRGLSLTKHLSVCI